MTGRFLLCGKTPSQDGRAAGGQQPVQAPSDGADGCSSVLGAWLPGSPQAGTAWHPSPFCVEGRAACVARLEPAPPPHPPAGWYDITSLAG